MRTLVAIPVFNEEGYAARVLERVLSFSPEWFERVLVIDDGSTDATPEILRRFDVSVLRHERNAGYGRSLRDAFAWADRERFDWVVTMDCDEQHEPDALPVFIERAGRCGADIISGSRYMSASGRGDSPPPDRRAINARLTQAINDRLGLKLTDSFCGFKAHRVEAMRRLELTEDGYAFPMQLWVQVAAMGLRVCEAPVRLIYNDPSRSFGGALDEPTLRLRHYCDVLEREIERFDALLPAPPAGALAACQG